MAAHSRALGGESHIDHTMTRTVSRETYDSGPLTLAELACSATNIVTLSGRADNHRAPFRRGGVSCLG
jgi:hypothetical protein